MKNTAGFGVRSPQYCLNRFKTALHFAFGSLILRRTPQNYYLSKILQF